MPPKLEALVLTEFCPPTILAPLSDPAFSRINRFMLGQGLTGLSLFARSPPPKAGPVFPHRYVQLGVAIDIDVIIFIVGANVLGPTCRKTVLPCGRLWIVTLPFIFKVTLTPQATLS